jgi:hypothetical protein
MNTNPATTENTTQGGTSRSRNKSMTVDAIVRSKLERASLNYHGPLRRIHNEEEEFDIEKIGYFMQVQSACGVRAAMQRSNEELMMPCQI